MRKTFRRRIVSFLMALMLLTMTGASTAHAAGIETFWLNRNYHVGAFTFRDHNTTPKKTVEGRYLYTYFNMTRASSDGGNASTPITVTVTILDASSLRQIGGGATYVIPAGGYMNGGFETDLGYAGRQVYIKFQASSNRSVYV